MKNLTATALVCIAAFGLTIPVSAQAEVGGYFSVGTAIGQTKSTYEGGLLFPLSELNSLTSPTVSQYLDPGFVGTTQSKTGLRLEAGYDFFFVGDYYVGAFGQLDTTGGNGGNKPKVVGPTTVITAGTTARPIYSQTDYRFQVATETKLGSSYTLGLTAGRTFDQVYVAASLGYSFASAELAFGSAFDPTFGARLGTTTTLPTAPPTFAPGNASINRSTETLKGFQFGLEAGYSLNDAWDVVVSGSTVDFGKIAVDSPAGGSKLAVGFKATRGGIVLRRRF